MVEIVENPEQNRKENRSVLDGCRNISERVKILVVSIDSYDLPLACIGKDVTCIGILLVFQGAQHKILM